MRSDDSHMRSDVNNLYYVYICIKLKRNNGLLIDSSG